MVLWILERFGKMGKWDKLWDIGIYFVDGKDFIPPLNTPHPANIPCPYRWITTRVGDTVLYSGTYVRHRYDRLLTEPVAPHSYRFVNYASTDSTTFFGRPGFPPPAAFLAFNSAIRI